MILVSDVWASPGFEATGWVAAGLLIFIFFLIICILFTALRGVVAWSGEQRDDREINRLTLDDQVEARKASLALTAAKDRAKAVELAASGAPRGRRS
jgi:nitrogen fixation protein FixH